MFTRAVMIRGFVSGPVLEPRSPVGTRFLSGANFRPDVNHCNGGRLVFGEKQNDWISTCRIASCESIRYIAEQYVLRLQIDCASF
jgi:hypothetical protein